MGRATHAIQIATGGFVLNAELNRSPTAQAIWEALPLEGVARRWGDEIYFEIPVEMAQAPEARAEVGVGELAYWPVGRALCIFFGPTPVSTDEQPRAYSPVNVVGQISDDAGQLVAVRDGARVGVTRRLV